MALYGLYFYFREVANGPTRGIISLSLRNWTLQCKRRGHDRLGRVELGYLLASYIGTKEHANAHRRCLRFVEMHCAPLLKSKYGEVHLLSYRACLRSGSCLFRLTWIGTVGLHLRGLLRKKLPQDDLHKEIEQLAAILMTKNDQFMSYYEKTGRKVSFKIIDRPTSFVPLKLHPRSPMF